MPCVIVAIHSSPLIPSPDFAFFLEVQIAEIAACQEKSSSFTSNRYNALTRLTKMLNQHF